MLHVVEIVVVLWLPVSLVCPQPYMYGHDPSSLEALQDWPSIQHTCERSDTQWNHPTWFFLISGILSFKY
jgi:hypothetical protein